MSTYASLEDLLARASVDALAEAAAPDKAHVDGGLLAAVLAESLGEYSSEIIADGRQALARLRQVLSDVSAEVDGYVAQRYSGLDIHSRVLMVHTIDIALYRLLGGDKDSERYGHYQAAIQYLRDVATGKIDLIPSAGETGGEHSVQISAGARQFSEQALEDY